MRLPAHSKREKNEASCVSKGGLVSESSSSWPFLQKNVLYHYPQLFKLKWKNRGLWFGKFCDKTTEVENFMRLSHL